MRNNKDVDSLSHTTWRCRYHVVFAPKYRRMVVYGQIKKDIGQMLGQLRGQKGIEIIEAEACSDHMDALKVCSHGPPPEVCLHSQYKGTPADFPDDPPISLTAPLNTCRKIPAGFHQTRPAQ